MSDWRELPAGRELDQVIADKLGMPTQDDMLTETVYLLPNYSISVDAALTLPIEGAFWEMDSSGSDYWRVDLYVDGEALPTTVHESLALAICRAWLAWKESEGR